MGRGTEKKDKRSRKPRQPDKSHSVWSNYRVAFSWLREIEGAGYFFLQAAYVASSVAMPFFAMALPGAVVYLLGSGWEPGRIFLALAGYVLALQGIQVAASYLKEYSHKKHLILRVSLGTQLFGAGMDADYQELESKAGKKKLNDAMMNIYYGNNRGIEAFLNALWDFLIHLLGLILYSAVLGRQSAGILALSLGAACAAAVIHGYAHKRAVRYDEKYEKVWQDYNAFGSEVLASENGKDIRLYHMWSWIAGEFERLKKEFVYWGHRHWKCNRGRAEFAEKCLVFARDLLVYGYLIGRMVQGRMEVSAFLVYIGVTAGFGGWMTPLLDAFANILENSRYMGNYRVFLELGEEPQRRQTFSRKACTAGDGRTHEICLEHVTFRYEGNQEDTIHDLSLTIASGEKIALVGMNGAGKSTLVKLICGLYRPTSGRILLDGTDVSEFAPKDYFREFAVVFQDVFSFSIPLGENVTCKSPDRTDGGRLRASLEKAELWDKVQTLERRERTYMNKDLDPAGVSLSGGETQKLMLARALYKDAPVLILDEPTAALDPLAESSLYEKYYEMTRGRTSVFISHRLSSTRFCDRILFMENGRITEEGSHEELMAGQGAYAAMFRTQAQYYQTEQGRDGCPEDGCAGEM